MPVLIGTARNLSIHHDDATGKDVPSVEVVLICCDTGYTVTKSGKVAKHRELEAFRFLASSSDLRQFASQLVEYAGEADKLASVKGGTVEPVSAD